MERKDVLWDLDPDNPIGILTDTALSLADSRYGYSQTEDIISNIAVFENFIPVSILMDIDDGT